MTGRFNLDAMSDFASCARPPEIIRSIRSWLFSALIWSDAESEPSQQLTREELTTGSPTTRFWLLSGLNQVKASYLRSTASELAAASPADTPGEELLTEFRGELELNVFQSAWPILRVMRTVPLPPLLADACRLFLAWPTDSQMAYDALYALCGDAPRATALG